MATKLDKMGINILGTAAQNIDRAEDRSKFSAMCDELGIDQPEWSEFVKLEDGQLHLHRDVFFFFCILWSCCFCRGIFGTQFVGFEKVNCSKSSAGWSSRALDRKP